MKDRIHNRLAVGDKVVVALPEPQVFGFISKIEDAGLITTGRQQQPGHVIVSVAIALPADSQHTDMVFQVVKVYDADKETRDEAKDKPRLN